ncbi:MAG: GvpL/GvpF family gas vesicle protein [Deltaproteobacteria bacterium]|nr:GvpL/GvpF family gas vesicle protein [Deltaproteobacteria bacterium]
MAGPKNPKKRSAKSTPKKASAEAASLATYVYCVLRADHAERSSRAAPDAPLAKRGRRLPDASAPRLLDAGGGHHLVVSSVPLPAYSAPSIEAKLRDLDWIGGAAAAHEAVIEGAAARGVVVPMKMFTIFTNDARAVEHVAKTKRRLDRAFSNIAGCDEWGLRILFDEAAALERKRARARERPTGPISGKSFLLGKKAQEDTRRGLTSEAKLEVDDLFERLQREAKKAVRRAPPSRELAARVMLDAVFLVPRKSTEHFTSRVAQTAKGLARDGYQISLTGPWPAYSFVEER